MKTSLISLFSVAILSSCSTVQTSTRSEVVTPSKQPPPRAATSTSLEGTTWSGKDSDGDFYEYTFLPGGRLRYRTNTSRDHIVTFEDEGDVWGQAGRNVIIAIGGGSTNTGTIDGNQISGDAWNIKGEQWTWKVTKRK